MKLNFYVLLTIGVDSLKLMLKNMMPLASVKNVSFKAAQIIIKIGLKFNPVSHELLSIGMINSKQSSKFNHFQCINASFLMNGSVN